MSDGDSDGDGEEERDAKGHEHDGPEFIPDTDAPLKPVRTHSEILANADRSHFIETDEENLGENFESTPWLPPSIQKAMEFRINAIFRMGSAPLRSVKVVNASDLGTGNSLYFQFTKSMAICMIFTTILSFPSMIFCFFGQRIPEQDRDAIGLYRFTLGNIGYDTQSLTYAADAACKSAALAHYNGTCIHLPGGTEITMEQTSSVLTVLEFLQIIVFFATVWYLQRKTRSLKQQNEALECAVSDYTVQVSNLPKDTTVEQLVSHFTNLYQLDKVDWKKRPPIIGSRPVQSTNNSGDPVHLNTWVAECVLHRKIGSFISAFKKQQHLTEKLFRSRAEMKMYSENTPHKYGPKPWKYARAEKLMIHAGSSIDMLAEKELRMQRLQLKEKPPAEKDVEAGTSTGAGKSTKDHEQLFEADVVAAFVTFEYTESMARCIEDYSSYSQFPWNLCYPANLKFKGHRLQICKAPEPDEIVFENLEVGFFSRYFRRMRTTLVTLILLVISFAVILQATVLQKKFSSSIPNLSLCSSAIPALYANNNASIPWTEMKLTAPPLATDKAYLDATCDSIIPGSFYVEYVLQGDWTQPVGQYNISSCVGAATLCPLLGQSSFCPCITTTDSETCNTAECSVDPNSPLCMHFTEATIGDCYCMNELLTMLTSGGFSSVESNVKAQAHSVCSKFVVNYTTATGLSYLSMLVTVIINAYLLTFLDKLTSMECHVSIDEEQGSMMNKMFFSTYFNIAILVILASAKMGSAPDILKQLEILQGQYNDFNVAWYGKIGSYFITMFFIQAMTPILTILFAYYITAPLARCRTYGAVSMQASTSIVMQSELNNLEVGPVFNTTTNQAHLLSLLFFAMTYAAGLPVIMLLSCVTFTLYFNIDKMLVCRYFQKPPHISEGIMKNVLKLLPYAAIIRLAVACWMYGSPDFLVSTVQSVSTNLPGGSSTTVSTSSYSAILSAYNTPASVQFIVERIGRPNVFPLFVLLLIIIGVKLIRFLWTKLPLYWVLKFLSCLIKAGCVKSSKIYDEEDAQNGAVHGFDLQQLNDPLRQEICPFTGEYYKYMRDKNEIPNTCCKMMSFDSQLVLTEVDADEGWDFADKGHFVTKVKVWRTTAVVGGITRARGDHKRTYEVINDHGCSSYNMENIPAYAMAMKGMKQAVQSLLSYNDASGAGDQQQAGGFMSKYASKKKLLADKNQSASQKWGKNVDDETAALEAKNKPKKKMTTKQKNAAAGQDLYNTHKHDDDESDSEDDDDDDDDEDGRNKKKEDSDDSDGSGLV